MTDQELLELWGDGTEFYMPPDMVGIMNSAFREVAIKFAKRVLEYQSEKDYDKWVNKVLRNQEDT